MSRFTKHTGRAVAIAARHTYLGGVKPQEYSDEFYTPPAIVQPLGAFDLDPCAGPTSHLARRNIRPPGDGLKARWQGRVWLNPPYSNIYDWIAKFQAHANGIILVNARCETRWWQQLAAGADAILFPAGRIKFFRPNKPCASPPVGSALIAYGPANATALQQSGIRGIFLQPRTTDH